MALLDDTYFDFSDMDVFRNDPPISGIQFPTAPDDSPLFEPPDAHFFDEDNEAVMGLKSYQPLCGSLSPSTNSCMSDDMPATPLSSGAETAELEINQTVFINQTQNYAYAELLDQFEREGGASSGGHTAVQGEQNSSGVGPVQPTDCMASPCSTKVVSSTAVAARREQTSQKKTINAVSVMSTSEPSSTRPTVTAARGSSNARQDMNNVAKSDAVRVGVKRKTDQGKEKTRKMKSCEDSTISRNEKNAIAAKENRLKKKMEFEDLKRNEALLEEENQCLHFWAETIESGASWQLVSFIARKIPHAVHCNYFQDYAAKSCQFLCV